MTGLRWSDGLVAEARGVRAAVAAELARLSVSGDLVLTGATSVPGTLTKGDVDLHLRVDPGAFASVVDRLTAVLPVATPSSWAATLAVFDATEVAPGTLPTGLAVTPVGSAHDLRFRRTWAALGRDPALLAEYNALKRAAAGSTAYEPAKSAFFDRVSALG